MEDHTLIKYQGVGPSLESLQSSLWISRDAVSGSHETSQLYAWGEEEVQYLLKTKCWTQLCFLQPTFLQVSKFHIRGSSSVRKESTSEFRWSGWKTVKGSLLVDPGELWELPRVPQPVGGEVLWLLQSTWYEDCPLTFYQCRTVTGPEIKGPTIVLRACQQCISTVKIIIFIWGTQVQKW